MKQTVTRSAFIDAFKDYNREDNFCYCRLEAGDYWRNFHCGKEINFWEAAK